MIELIGKLEAASEGSRELDAEICSLVEPHPQGSAGPEWRLLPQGTQQHVPTVAPAYTTSLDAALTLWPEGYIGLQRFSDGWYAQVAPHSTAFRHEGTQKPAALALCIAALKGREAKP